MKLLLFQQNVMNFRMISMMQKSFIFSASLFSLFGNPSNAGVFDWFKKDSCKAYSDYTCKQLENSSYNVYFYWPSDKEEYLGQSYSLSGCGDMASNFAYQKDVSSSDWGYICCLMKDGSSCAEKHR